jgi:hypothetical protein
MKKISSTDRSSHIKPAQPSKATEKQALKAPAVTKSTKVKNQYNKNRVKKLFQKKFAQLQANGIEDVSAYRKAFIESALSWEFGSDIANDPDLTNLINDINEDLGSESQILKDFELLLEEMKKEDSKNQIKI